MANAIPSESNPEPRLALDAGTRTVTDRAGGQRPSRAYAPPTLAVLRGRGRTFARSGNRLSRRVNSGQLQLGGDATGSTAIAVPAASSSAVYGS